MANLDEIFYKEFQESMRCRRASYKFNLQYLPLPAEFMGAVPKRNMVLARGIQDEKYSVLNYDKTSRTLLSLVGNTKLRKNVYLSDGSIRRDKDGTPRTCEVTVPRNSEGVISSIPVSSLYKSSQGFEFVDRLKDRVNGTKFIYIIPRKYLYRVNLCSLVVRLDRLRNSYTAIQLTLVNGHRVYLHVVPFSPTRKHDKGTRVLRVKNSANFDKEIKSLLYWWQNNGVIFPLSSTAFEEPIKGVYNCALEHYDTNLSGFRKYDTKSMEESDVIDEY